LEEDRTLFQQYRLTCRYFLHLHINNSFQFLRSRFKISTGIPILIFAYVFRNLVNIEEKSGREIQLWWKWLTFYSAAIEDPLIFQRKNLQV
jgi:hypothetical protein